MGIKFIKLDPESRTIVDRIIHARGGKPSRFEQTEGAAIAAPSAPPSSPTPAPISATPASAPNAKPAGQRDSVSVSARAALPKPAAPAAQRATPAPAAVKPAAPPPPRAPAPAPRSRVVGVCGAAAPALRDGRCRAPHGTDLGAPGVAGLFADSPLVRGSAAPAPEPVPSTGRSSFFPPAPNGASVPSPPPPRRLRMIATKPPRPSRRGGEFLATAFAEGGVTDAARRTEGRGRRGRADRPALCRRHGRAACAPRRGRRPHRARSLRPRRARSATSKTCSQFLSDEGVQQPAGRARLVSGRARARVSPVAASTTTSTICELNDAQRPARAASSHPPPSPQRRASSPEPESLPTWEEPTSALKEDLQGTTSVPRPARGARSAAARDSEPPPPPARSPVSSRRARAAGRRCRGSCSPCSWRAAQVATSARR